MAVPDIPCPYCAGTGTKNGFPCEDCGGDGLKAPAGIHETIYGYSASAEVHILDVQAATTNIYNQGIDILDKVNDVKEKCDATQAYLETLRTDLTTALTAIWNKVKNL